MAHLYGLDWIALIVLIVAYYVHAHGWQRKGSRYAQLYETAQQSRYGAFPTAYALNSLRCLIYGVVVAAVFVFYYKYDACVVHNALYGASETCWSEFTDHEYTAVWVLLLVNWALLKLATNVAAMGILSQQRVLASLWFHFLAFGTAVAISILFYVGKHYFPAVVFTILSVWLAMLVYIGWVLYSRYRKLCQCMPPPPKCGCE